MQPSVSETGEIGINTFGGGAAETSIGMGATILVLIVIVLVFVLPRRSILSALLFGAILVPFGQTLVIAGVHLYVVRILILSGILRVVASRSAATPLFGSRLIAIDKLFVLWIFLRAAAIIIRLGEIGAVVNQCGIALDSLGGYFLIRFLIHTDEDVLRVVKTLAIIAAVAGGAMALEKWSGTNIFGVLASEPIIPAIRNGSIRAQGPFHHAILAGVFGATLLPLFCWLWSSGKARFLGLTGLIASTIITAVASSSTPVSAYTAAVLAICLWPLRNQMRIFRWGIVIGMLILNFAMTAPVWWALEHIDFASGSAGEHRAELVDNFVRHFGDWWLIGTSDNANWGYEMWDLSNQYIAEGEQGGLAVFVCFVAIMCLGFKWVGISRKAAKENRPDELLFWFLGAAWFSHSVAYLGISYFDQTRLSWFVLVAIICTKAGPFVYAKIPSEESGQVTSLVHASGGSLSRAKVLEGQMFTTRLN